MPLGVIDLGRGATSVWNGPSDQPENMRGRDTALEVQRQGVAPIDLGHIAPNDLGKPQFGDNWGTIKRLRGVMPYPTISVVGDSSPNPSSVPSGVITPEALQDFYCPPDIFGQE